MRAPPPGALSTDRLRLRPLEAGDAEALTCWLGDPELRRALQVVRAPTLAEERALIEEVARSPDQVVLGIVGGGGRLLGVAGLHGLPGGQKAQLGIFIGDPAERGKGLGTEAARLLVAHGFGAMGLERIGLHVLADNRPAIRSYEKVGFQVERAGEVVAMVLRRRDWS